MALVFALWLGGCRIERVDGADDVSAPTDTVPTGIAEPLAWSRDVAVIVAIEPAPQGMALTRAVRQLSKELCERLTLQGDVEAAWHSAVTRLEREVSARGYVASDALLSSSDGRWGASVLTSVGDELSRQKSGRALLMDNAWHYWERGSGLQLLPEPVASVSKAVAVANAKATAPSPTSKPAAADASAGKTAGVAPSAAGAQVALPTAVPVIEDPSRNWVSVLPVVPEQPAAPKASAAPSGSPDAPAPGREVDGPALDGQSGVGDEDAGVGPEPSAEAVAGAGSDEAATAETQPDVARVALLVRLSDGSFRGGWVRATSNPAKVDAVMRDVVIGERLYTGALGAVFALETFAQPLEPSAASRGYERLLQPGTGKAAATLVLTAASLEVDDRPGVFALSSRGAQAGKCRSVEQESAL